MTKASQGGESLLSPRCVDLLSPRLSLSVTILAEIRPHAGWDLGDKEMSPEVAPFPSQLLWLGDTSEQLPSPEGSWGEQGKDPETPGASLQGEFPGPDPQVAGGEWPHPALQQRVSLGGFKPTEGRLAGHTQL